MIQEVRATETLSSGAAPLAFGPHQRQLFGFYHAPDGETSRGIAVVLCNPLGYEAMCAHRAYRHFAERLAARGFPALRFDYHGTGDSSGHPDEPGRLLAWLEGIDAAIGEVRERAGVSSIALFGVRVGATLATLAAGRRGDVDGLILWAPSPEGRAYVRELRAFRMIKDPGAAPSKLRDGGEEVAGYFFDNTTVSDVSAIDLFARTDRAAKFALIVPRDDLHGNEERLAKHLVKTGVDVQVAVEPGYARMMRDPQDTIVPVATLDRMIEWLGEAKVQLERPTSAPKPTSSSTAVLMATGSRRRARSVKEHLLRFGEGNRLFGIATEPSDGRDLPDRPAVILLNVGANHRVGPNRMYVPLSRDLASLGYWALRFDVAGLGDSNVAPFARENRLYSKDSIGDVKAAMTLLAQAGWARRFVLVGLCSGAYLGFHTAVEDVRVVGQALLNPQTFEWKEGDSLELSTRRGFLSTRYYARALFKPQVWRRGIRGELNVRGIGGELRSRFVARARMGLKAALTRLQGHSPAQTDIERAFRTLSKRGVASLLVFSFEDGGVDMIERHLGVDAERMRGEKNFRMEIVQGADHTFTPLASQAVLHDLLIRWVTERFS